MFCSRGGNQESISSKRSTDASFFSEIIAIVSGKHAHTLVRGTLPRTVKAVTVVVELARHKLVHASRMAKQALPLQFSPEFFKAVAEHHPYLFSMYGRTSASAQYKFNPRPNKDLKSFTIPFLFSETADNL